MLQASMLCVRIMLRLLIMPAHRLAHPDKYPALTKGGLAIQCDVSLVRQAMGGARCPVLAAPLAADASGAT